MAGYWLPIFSGTLLALVFYEPQAAPVLFVSFLPAYIFLKNRTQGLSGRASVRLGAIAGVLIAFVYLIFAAAALWPSQEAGRYIVGEIFNLSPDRAPLALIAAEAGTIFLISIWLSLPYALWGGGTALLMSRNAPIALGSDALWVIAEFLRRKMFFDISWGDIGYSFANYPLIGATARFWGKYGIAILVVSASALLFELGIPKFRRRAVLELSALGIVAMFLGGFAMRSTSRTMTAGKELRVAAVQGYLPWGQKVPERTDEPFSFPEPYRLQLEELSDTEYPDIVLLPEEIVHDFPVPVAGRAFPEPMVVRSPFWESEAAAIEEYLQKSGASVFIVGQPIKRGRAFYNAMLAFDSEGNVSAYGKRKLFPFIERLPALLNLTPLGERLGQYTPGAGSPLLKLAAGNFFVVSCLEIESDALLHRFLGEEPSVIIAAGSEIGFSEAARRYQLELARFRALEQDKWLVRATKRGFSALVDPLGRVVSVVPASDADSSIRGSVFPRPGKTPYSRMGDIPEVIAAIFLAGWGIIMSAHASKRSGS